MRFQGQYLRLFTFIYFVGLLRAKKLCDVRVWYLNLINDDVFDADLTDDQLTLKTTIESLVMKASESRETRMLECSTLYLYNDMLKDVFDYTPSGTGMALKEVESEDSGERKDTSTTGNDNTVTSSDDDEVPNKQTQEESDDSLNHENVDGPEKNVDGISIDMKTDEFDGNVDVRDKRVETLFRESETDENAASLNTDDVEHFEAGDNVHLSNEEDKIDDSKGNSDINSVDTHIDEIQDIVDFDNIGAETLAVETNTDKSGSKDDVEHDLPIEDNLSNEGDKLDETDYLDDTDIDLSVNDDISETNRNYRDPQTDEEELDSDVYKNQTGTYKTKTISFGICYALRCLMSDIFFLRSGKGFNSISNGVKSKTNIVHILFKSKFKLKCPLRTFCSSQCFYKFLLSKSFCMVGFINNTLLSPDDNKDNSQVQNVIKEDLKEHDSIEISNVKTEKPTPVPKIIEYFNMNTDIQEEYDKNIDEKSSKSESAKSKGKHGLSLTEFESIVDQKTKKYYSKIQHLEVMIIKLENKLLTTALDKQNHSTTITKLENQILKLENELLRMNRNYQNLRAETENTSKRQHKYLELAYKQSNKEYPKLPDKSSQKYELIAQHQMKINELGELLRNQSSIIMQLKKKHDQLEEQNKMLHEMVMNQTIFMKSIVKTVQDLSEQNIKNQNEISDLRLKVARNSDAVAYEKEAIAKINDNKDIIDRLDTLVFNNLSEKSSSVKKDKIGSVSEVSKHRTDRLKSSNVNGRKPGNSIVTKRCPKDSYTCPSCQYSPHINSNCLPFRNVFWTGFKETKVSEQNVEESDYPTVPDVIDAIKTKEFTLVQKEDNIVKNYNNDDENNEVEKFGDAYEELNADFDKEKHTDVKSDINNNLGKYTLVGYDRDGKPVLKTRENPESEEAKSEHLLDDSKLEPEAKPNKIQGDDGLTSNKNEIKTEHMTNKQVGLRNIDSESEQDNLKTSDLPKPILDEENENKNNELEDKDNKNDKINDINEDSKRIIENTESSKAKNVDTLDNTKQDATISNQGKDIKSRDEKGVDEENQGNKGNIPKDIESKDENGVDEIKQENKGNKPKEDSEQNKQTSKVSQIEDKENSKNNREQQGNKDTKAAEIKAKEDDHKKIKQSESKQKERKSPIHIDKAKQSEPKDCYDIYIRGERRDGLFKVKPLGSDNQIQVFCDMRRGGWTVIQRRQDGSTSFFQEWNDYKKGFGGLYGEHWLGNDNIHYLTNQDYYKLRVDLMDWEKAKKFAEFDYFLVDNEDESYRLHVDGYKGDAGDGLTKHDESKFSTKDVDNDKVVKEFGGSCAKRFHGAGWYYKCYASNLNGKFYKGGKIPEKKFDGITWKPWTGPNYSLKKVEMKIKPASAKN